MFEAASSTTETPDPEGVVEAFVKLIETPAGKRPFRTVPTAAIQPLLENYNALAATMRDTVAQIFQVPELTVLQQTGSWGVQRRQRRAVGGAWTRCRPLDLRSAGVICLKPT